MGAVRVVERRVHHHDQPRRRRAVDFCEVVFEPFPLEAVAAVHEVVVAVQRDDMRGSHVRGPVQGARRARFAVGRRPPVQVVEPCFRGADLVITTGDQHGHAREQRGREGPETVPAPGPAVRVGPVWKSRGELGFPEKYCADLRDPPRIEQRLLRGQRPVDGVETPRHRAVGRLKFDFHAA